MTHNELIEAVNSPTYMSSRTLEHPYIALRAVLEIHAPFESGVCGCEIDNPVLSYMYPCATVRAIEKELSI